MNDLSRLDRLALEVGVTPTELRWLLLEKVDQARWERDRLIFQDDTDRRVK